MPDIYAVHVIVKVRAHDAEQAQADAMDAVFTIPDSVLAGLADEPYALKAEKEQPGA